MIQNAIGYKRISIKDQSRYSLDYQDKSIRDYCSFNKLNLLEIFQDDGECSESFDRPNYLELEEFIRLHKGEVQFLIVLDHDRFSRNLPEALQKIAMLEKKYGIKVIACNEPLDIDTTDPSVFMQRAFKYLIANEELLRIRRRTRNGIRQALESGRFVNKAPYGYLNKKDGQNKGFIVIKEDEARIVRKIFFDFLLGLTISQVYKEAQGMGFTNTSHGIIPRVLNNCTYAGLVKLPANGKSPERYIKGMHEGIVSESDYWRCQEILGRKKPNKSSPKENVPLRGVIKCKCGKNLTASDSRSQTGRYYTYYRCMDHQGWSIPAPEIHKRFQEMIEHLSWNDEQIGIITSKVKAIVQTAIDNRAVMLEKQNELMLELNKKIDTLEGKLMNEEIEGATYKKWYRKYVQERAQIQSVIDGLKRNNEGKWERFSELIPYLTKVPILYMVSDLLQKHTLVKRWFQHGLVYKEGVFGTRSLHPAFAHNELVLKEKGLLLVEQSSDFFDKSLIRSENEI